MSAVAPVPALRIQPLNAQDVRADGDYVLYWMSAARRPGWNFGLQRAAWWAESLGKPLVVLEALRVGYAWASDRFHRFVLDGMAANARAFAPRGAHYYPYVEPAPDAGKGLIAALAASACLVVADEYPAFFLPHALAAAATQCPVRFEAIDSNGILPLRAAPGAFPLAHAFRRYLHKTLLPHLGAFPMPDPLAGLTLVPLDALAPGISARWPAADPGLLAGDAGALAALPIAHGIGVVADAPGGHEVARRVLARFLHERLPRYADERNAIAPEAASGLSPYLHFGHIGAHEVFAALMREVGWDPSRLAPKPTGSREGWWGAGRAAEAFLDELVTWRELGYGFCAHRPDDYDRYDALPDWARKTLVDHAADPRPHRYDLATLEAGNTHDRIWNAAQTELVRDGRMHNYLRMLWGKKVLEWSESPQVALETLITLNNKYALDGRDPNSYSGIFWVFGRFDRAWGPERPIFGKIRYMSSDNTARKLDLKPYLARYGSTPAGR